MKIVGILFTLAFFACWQLDLQYTNPTINRSETAKAYWYDGKAELSSYKLTQARYGELHEGTAVLVYVTEPFSKKNHTKVDYPTENDPSVLKLNFTRKFVTGIYPYSAMTSSFFPFDSGDRSLKISSSMQEWCGHSYLELNNDGEYKIDLSSYFEGESFHGLTLNQELMEDDLWSMIRLDPSTLPTGKTTLIPSFLYLKLRSKEVKAYQGELSLSQKSDTVMQYTVNYPTLDRLVHLNFETEFPHRILSWDETYTSGYGENTKKLTTKGTLITTSRSDYWNENLNEHNYRRKELGLE